MMSELLSSAVFFRLKALSRLFVWRRRALHAAILADLHAADALHAALAEEHKASLAQLHDAKEQCTLAAKRQALTDAALTEERSARLALQSALTDVRSELDEKSIALEQARTAFSEEQATHRALIAEFSGLQNRYGETWTRFQLVSELLASRPAENPGIARFQQLLANDFMAFAESESSLAAEAKALIMLQSIEQELRLLVGFPEIFRRTIVGIVGGFSSGKSEFINSFIQNNDIRLPVGLQPVTAIPSYVLSADQALIRGYSANGGHVELSKEFYKGVSHAFINSFSFDLNTLMPFMCLGVPMDAKRFGNICFIDTPGYNPPATSSEYARRDKRTALDFAKRSETILWIVGLDATGTIPSTDIDFMRSIGVENRTVYVVLNKADLKSEIELESLMNEVEAVLELEQISAVGISAYSSRLQREMGYRKVSLMEHFVQINKPKDAQIRLEVRLQEVFAMYGSAIRSDIEIMTLQKRRIKSLALDAMEIGGEELFRKMRASIAKLEGSVIPRPLQQWLAESNRLLEAFREAISQATSTVEEEALEELDA